MRHYIWIPNTGLIFRLVLAVVLCAMAPAGAATTLPACSDLQAWVSTVEPKNRWNPIEGSRAWLPAAFREPAFVEIFGAPPLEWTQAEAREIANRLFECGSEAGEAGDRGARTALHSARGWFQGNLVGVLVAHSRTAAAAKREADDAARRRDTARQQEARRAAERQGAMARRQAEAARADALQAALDDVVNQPDSVRLLQSLIVLRDTNPRDALAVNSAIGRFGQKAGALLGQARHLKLRMGDDPIGPVLDRRIGELRANIVADYAQRVDALDAAEPGALRFLARWEEEVRDQLADPLGAQITSDLLERIAGRRGMIEDDILLGLMQRIDAAAEASTATEGLATIEETTSRGQQAGLSTERLGQLDEHAATMEKRLAERAVVEAEAALSEVPEDLDGLDFLLKTIPRADRPPLAYAPPAVLSSYREAAHARLQTVARAARPAFEAGLDALPEDRQGLALLKRTVASDKAFSLVSPDVRKMYLEALDGRRTTIRAALREAMDEARQAAVKRGGDADLVGHVFENQETGLAVGFVDEKRAVVGLNGREDTAPYAVRDDRVLVYGQGMTLQLFRSGNGSATTLEWLGKPLQRRDR